jgi:NitT/TauT family transport system substrate-binding protein
MNRRQLTQALLAAPLATPFLARAALAQEVSAVTLVMQHGLPYLPLMVMQAQKLVEKHVAKLDLPVLTPDYRQLGGTSSLVDALISGQMHFGIIGTPGVITLWDKTAGTQNEVRALCAVQSMPFVLVTNNPSVKTIRDFTDKDKIALPSVKVSAQAVCLQMAAAKEWGADQFARLDPLTVTRSHPDAAAAIIGGGSEITGHYAVAPFYYQELAAKGTSVALRSYDTLGGPATNGALVMSKKFGDANPKVTAAVYAAMTEANAFVNASPLEAAAIYIAYTNEKKSTPAEIAKMIADPDNVWTTAPQNTMKYLAFMNKAGTVKRVAASWRDYMMPNAHELAGS